MPSTRDCGSSLNSGVAPTRKYMGRCSSVAVPSGGKDVASIANGKILVPSAFFKVIASRDRSGKWHRLGFVFENEPLEGSDDIFGYAVDVQEIEQTTGLVFFPEIKNAMEDPAERFWNIRWKKR